MHSTLTTDLSILYENLNGTTDTNKEYVVLLKTGALNQSCNRSGKTGPVRSGRTGAGQDRLND
jgi:hypothetical protein